MALSSEQIKALYEKKSRPAVKKPAQGRLDRTKYPRIINHNYAHLPQNGPVTLHDATLRCGNRGCSSPTYYKLRGIPYCSTHLIIFLATEVANGNTASGAGVASSGGNNTGDGEHNFEGNLTDEGTL